MDELDRIILDNLSRYHMGVRPVLRQFFADEQALDVAISRLQRSGLLWAGRSLPGGRAIYQLTKKGAAAIGVSESRARPLRPASLFKHLGILLWCHVEGSRRYRIEDSELRDYLGDALPDAAHCMGLIDDQPILFSLYVPGQRTSLKSVTRRVRVQLNAANDIPAVRQLLAQKRYAFAIITDTHQRRKAIVSVLHKPDRRGPALARRARIIVEAIPAFDQLINGVSMSEGKRGKRARKDVLEEATLFKVDPGETAPAVEKSA